MEILYFGRTETDRSHPKLNRIGPNSTPVGNGPGNIWTETVFENFTPNRI